MRYHYNVRTGIQKLRKKVFIALSVFGLLLGSGGLSLATFSTANATALPLPNWEINAPSQITFSCGGADYAHTLNTISENNTGNFSGTGYYNADNTYTWNITGNVSGDSISFTLVYTGSNAGYTLDGIGTIESDGSVSGSVDNNCQSFTMPTGTATPYTVTVTIDKFIDGEQATTVNANNISFPMASSWSATNISTGSGTYNLGPAGFNNPNSYMATTSNMSLGANYATNEVMGSTVATKCTLDGAPYALEGYSTGNTLAQAETTRVHNKTAPSFTNLLSNKYIVVWNINCKTPYRLFQCKVDGWKDFTKPSFKNQGDCISWVQHNVHNWEWLHD